MSVPPVNPFPPADDWLAALGDGDPMLAAIRSFDWSSTSLGPICEWPIGLRTALGICLTTRFPMMLAWGPDLIKIYNSGYSIMLQSKHPAALGQPIQAVWPEVWDEIGPLLHDVLATGEPTWAEHFPLTVNRSGFVEETYFTFSYSPLFEGGQISGVLDVAVETTEQVVGERRLECASLLAERLLGAQQITDVCVRALDAFTTASIDIRAADIYLLVDDSLALIASNRRDDVAPLDPTALAEALAKNTPMAVGWTSDALPAAHFAVPIGGAFGGIGGVVVITLNDRRPFDEAYRAFLHLVTDTISSALDGAHQRTMELGEYRRIGDTLQAAMLKPASDFPTVAARYLPAIGNLAVGGDWYDVIDLGDERRGLVVGDCVGHGLDAATVMSQLRSATRAMLLEGHAPAQVLERLDLFAGSVDGAFCTTVVCAIFDRAHGTVTYSRAGHPPPIVVNASGVTWLDQAGGAPLAVSTGQRRENAMVHLDGDDVIVLYSDGLIERRGESLDEGFARLAVSGRALYGATVHAIADGLLRSLLPENTRDDVVLVVKRLAPSAADGAEVDGRPADLVFEFISSTTAPRDARRAVAALFAHDPDLAESVSLAVSELVSNVVIHVGGSGRLLVWTGDPVRVEVEDTGYAIVPMVRRASLPSDPSGRGLDIVARLAQRWGTGASAHGNAVWAEFTSAPERNHV